MDKNKNNKRTGVTKILVLAAAVAAVGLMFHFTSLSISDFKPEKIKSFILQFGVMAPVVFIVIYSLRAVILVLPVGVMSLTGGLVFGKWLGTLYILIGATAGSCLSFLMARYLGRGFIEKLGVMKQGRLKAFDEGVEKNGFRMILFMRLVPLFQYDALNFGSGLSRMRFRDFALGSFIGMVPGGFINALLGSSLENVISVQFFAALGVFVLLMFVPAIYNLIKKRRAAKPPAEAQPVQGMCPVCGGPFGPAGFLAAWMSWGCLSCPGCGGKIRIKYWLGVAFLLLIILAAVERLFIALMSMGLHLAWIYGIVFILMALLFMLTSKLCPLISVNE